VHVHRSFGLAGGSRRVGDHERVFGLGVLDRVVRPAEYRPAAVASSDAIDNEDVLGAGLLGRFTRG
jgi:hypothetical protein